MMVDLPVTTPVIDCHVHAYPEGVGRATQAAMGNTNPRYEGTPEDLLRLLAQISTSEANGAILKNMTPTAEMAKAAWDRVDRRLSPAEERQMYADVKDNLAGRIRRRNEWGNEVTRRYPTLVNFIGVDPNFLTPEENVEELELRVGEGAKGISLHPTRNLHRPDDLRLWPLYERAQELDIPILTHGGTEGYRAAYLALNSAPYDFRTVLDTFPRLRLILGHMGNPYFDQLLEMAQRYPSLYFETAGVVSGREPYEYTDEYLVQLIRQLGTDRVMFGSDFIFGEPVSPAKRLLSLPLSDAEKEAILGRNAQQFLGP
jgi:predicted TIM-barrel fold metal-dependent hydrolase